MRNLTRHPPPESNLLGYIRAACIIAAICALLAGCGKREDINPAPSSSIAHAQAMSDAAMWAMSHPARRSFTTVLPTGSMAPVLDSRSVLLLEPAKGGELQVGDIAIYEEGGGKTICHRVRLVKPNAVLFTGDNNDSLRPDGRIANDRIRWRVAGILFTER